jgi:hypothetical protein
MSPTPLMPLPSLNRLLKSLNRPSPLSSLNPPLLMSRIHPRADASVIAIMSLLITYPIYLTSLTSLTSFSNFNI